jgi:hypothetical protein
MSVSTSLASSARLYLVYAIEWRDYDDVYEEVLMPCSARRRQDRKETGRGSLPCFARKG